jgi:N-acetylglutamate synthase-like GNAT family acetyltransferase
MSAGEMIIRRATLAEIVDLRHVILRDRLPRDEAIFDGDEAATSRHFAAVNRAGGAVVACATVHLNAWAGTRAWQLRGMATHPAVRKTGVGRRLLEFLERDLADAPDVRQLWCNARVPAVGFYERMGWDVVSEVFEIPTAGPHVRMTKRL